MRKPHPIDRLFAGLFMFALVPPLLFGQEPPTVSSIRDSQHEWQCEEQDGTKISGHVRPDKAIVACSNQALANPGTVYIARSGTYRIVATAGTSPGPVEPPPDPPEPPPPDPPPEPEDAPQVVFGPVNAPTEYPSNISALKQDDFRWEIAFNLDSLHDKQAGEARQATVQGLASRDESGQAESGHLSVWTEDIGTGDHRVRLRNQDIEGGAASVSLMSMTAISSGQNYSLTVSLNENGIALYLGGVLQDSSAISFGLDGNDLPIVVGGMRSRVEPGVGPHAPIDGTVTVEIWDDSLPAPEPFSASLRWNNPTERVDGTPLTLAEIGKTEILLNGVRTASVDGDVTGYEYVTLDPGQHCFTARTVDIDGLESDDSEQACKTF